MQDILQENDLSDVEMETLIEPTTTQDDTVPSVVTPIEVDDFEIDETVLQMVESVAAEIINIITVSLIIRKITN